MIIIGSRGSKLALWQAHWVRGELERLGHECAIEIIQTSGDKIADKPLPEIGGKGLFTAEIEDALIEGSIHVAVHSLKDLPTAMPELLSIAAIPAREDVRDAVCGKPLADLAHGAKVGTSSLRRAAQLRAIRPDLDILPIRGNVDTRLRKLDEGQYDSIVLALAGLRRLGLESRAAELLDPGVMCPAAGQGALAIETRADRTELVSALDHETTRAAVTAERALLAALGGGCQVPIGAWARMHRGELLLSGVVCAPDGSRVIRADKPGTPLSAKVLGAMLAQELLDLGARELL